MKTKVIVSRVVALCAMVAVSSGVALAQNQNTNVDFGRLPMGKYYINNNVWGQGGADASSWESIWTWGNASGSWGWGSNWSWTGGNAWDVKAYPSVVLGWHWGWERTGTGLPVRINANRPVNSKANFSVTGTNTLNVAYDLWFHTQSNPTWENNPSDEVMIWLYRQNGAGPLGTFEGTVNLAGTSWDLYRGNIGWNVFSFIRRSNTTNATMNLRDFYGEIVRRGWMANTKYLTSVQFGSEIFNGNGQLNVNEYYANVQ
ncbi:MAG: endo-1,4-beta-glucanase [Fibrella sp.]|nr:endo-1,4-beta-glucanase [Armatimonadota bacterium]